MPKNNTKHTNQRGAALIELIISVLVVGLVLTAVATTITYSIRVTSAARKQDLANSIAQDAIEALHRERALAGWNTFYAHFVAAGPGLYCIDQDQIDTYSNDDEFNNRDFSLMFKKKDTIEQVTQAEGECEREEEGLGVPFYQQLTITTTGGASGDSVQAEVNVMWDVQSTGDVTRLRQPIVKVFRETQ